MSAECQHFYVRYEQSSVMVRTVMVVLHKFVCTECRTTARVDDRFDPNN